MQISPVTPVSGGEAVRRFAAVWEAARRADSPWVPERPPECWAGILRHGWDGEPGDAYLGTVDGVDVVAGQYETSSYDNQHLAWLSVHVDPAHRRRGHGTAMLEFLLQRARGEGRTSVGIDGWEAEAPRAFAARHGFERKSVEVNRRQFLPRLDRDELEKRYDEALPHAASYELVRRVGRTPPQELEAVARMTEAINDAPTDDLDMEDEAFPPARIVAYETAQAGQGNTLYRVLARHRETGELAGHTIVAVPESRPQLAEQHDTAVVRAHRGHRLGLLLKLDMLRWLADVRPDVESIDTWNAASNDHMIAVNEALGYEVLGHQVDYQRSL